MMEITSKTTKAELIKAVTELEKTHEDFRRKVVDRALRVKKDHGLCDEVDAVLIKLGLTDVLPPRYVVSQKYGKTDKWETLDLGYDYEIDSYNKKDVLAVAAEIREEAVYEDRNEYEYTHSLGSWSTYNVNMTDPDDLVKLIDELNNRRKELESGKEPEIPPFVEPEYPKIRVYEVVKGKRTLITDDYGNPLPKNKDK